MSETTRQLGKYYFSTSTEKKRLRDLENIEPALFLLQNSPAFVLGDGKSSRPCSWCSTQLGSSAELADCRRDPSRWPAMPHQQIDSTDDNARTKHLVTRLSACGRENSSIKLLRYGNCDNVSEHGLTSHPTQQIILETLFYRSHSSVRAMKEKMVVQILRINLIKIGSENGNGQKVVTTYKNI